VTAKLGRPQRGGISVDDALHHSPPPSRAKNPSDRRGIDRYLDDDELESHARSILHPHPDDFHVAISDELGNDVKVAGIRMHPSMANEIMMMFHRGTFPWDTPHDIVRCAILDYLRKCQDIEKRVGGVPNYIARLEAINRTSLKYEEMLRFDQSRQRMHEVADKLIGAGKKAAAAEFIASQIAEIKEIPQKGWRDDLLKDMQRAYGWLVEGEGKPVKMKRGAGR
jgi:hypothetical protein